jgi:Fe-S-cluster containining protein
MPMKKAIETLQENASGFFDKINQKYPNDMKCKEGCSKCCYTDISVFEVESTLIREWFEALNNDEKESLISKWNVKSPSGACTFLVDDSCSIYPVRPIICRTQGAPLFLSQENILDYCPLNFEKSDPPKEDWLNLERLNTLLSFAASNAGLDQRIRLKKLKESFIIKNN